MTKSKGSVVVGGERSQDGLAGVVVVPDGGGEGEESLEDPDQGALAAVGAVAFEAELGLEGGVDGLDDLAQRLELGGAAPGPFVAAGGRTSSMPWSARRVSNSAEV
jgi:hypothetical protein